VYLPSDRLAIYKVVTSSTVLPLDESFAGIAGPFSLCHKKSSTVFIFLLIVLMLHVAALNFVNRHGHHYVADNEDFPDDASDGDDSDDDDSTFHPDPNDVAMDDDDDADEFDNVAPAFADLNDHAHYDLVAAPAVQIAGVDDVDVVEVDNDDHDVAIAGVDNDNVSVVNNENEEQIDPDNDNVAVDSDNVNTVEQHIDDEPDPNIDQIMDEQYGPRSDAYNLRPRKPRDYSHLHAVLEETVLTQHSLKTGIKLFGSAGVDAVLKELQQLHDRKVVEPVPSSTLNRERNGKLYLT
jgi:hypothetical protein